MLKCSSAILKEGIGLSIKMETKPNAETYTHAFAIEQTQ